jgi:hypothetical protein
VLNVLAFIIIGLQLKPILQGLSGRQRLGYLGFAAAVFGAAVVTRIVWVMGGALITGLVRRSRQSEPATVKSAIAIAWCGMRGIVTLAAALALPPGFPERDLLVFAAFGVVLGTLVVQGGTLGPLMRVLKLEDDGTVARELRLARARTAQAALEAMDAAAREKEAARETSRLVRRKYEVRLRRAEGSSAEQVPGADPTEFLRQVHAAERRALFDLRANGAIGDDAFHRVEEELDWAELNTEGMAREE